MSVEEINFASGNNLKVINGEYVIGAGGACKEKSITRGKVLNGEFWVDIKEKYPFKEEEMPSHTHNYCDFLPDNLIQGIATKCNTSRGCFCLRQPDEYITFYTKEPYNDCVPNYSFCWGDSDGELYTCADKSEFRIIGSMLLEDFAKIAKYNGERVICGGWNKCYTRR